MHPSNHELDCFHEQHGQHWLRIAALQRKPDNLAQSMQILQAVQGVKLRMREIGVFAKEVRELLQAFEASADGVVDPFGDIILLPGFVFRSKVLANKTAHRPCPSTVGRSQAIIARMATPSLNRYSPYLTSVHKQEGCHMSNNRININAVGEISSSNCIHFRNSKDHVQEGASQSLVEVIVDVPQKA